MKLIFQSSTPTGGKHRRGSESRVRLPLRLSLGARRCLQLGRYRLSYRFVLGAVAVGNRDRGTIERPARACRAGQLNDEPGQRPS